MLESHSVMTQEEFESMVLHMFVNGWVYGDDKRLGEIHAAALARIKELGEEIERLKAKETV